MSALDGEQRARAEAHAYVADRAAGMFRTRHLDRDERISAAGLGLVRSASKWRPGPATFETYAIKAALRQIRSDADAASRRRTVPFTSAVESREAARRNVEGGHERREAVARLRESVASLPARQRLAVEMYLSGLSRAEIAAAMAVGPSAVDNLRCKAFARLRQLLGDD